MRLRLNMHESMTITINTTRISTINKSIKAITKSKYSNYKDLPKYNQHLALAESNQKTTLNGIELFNLN